MNRRSAFALGLAATLFGACSAVVSPGPDAGADVQTPADLGPADAPSVCALPGGWTCALGQTCRAPDGCNTCRCDASGLLLCTTLGCIDAGPPGCALPGGGVCPRGRSCPLGDGCNSCSCGLDGVLACTGVVCADAGPPGCLIASDCGEGMECVFSVPSCGERGRCAPQSDCAKIASFCSCEGETFMGCGGRPGRPARAEAPCDAVPDGGAADAGGCEGAHIGVTGAYCAAPNDAPLPVSCCTGWNCDVRSVLCESLPPRCPAGWTNTANGSCWGPCVPAMNCAPMRCLGTATCPPGWTCDDASNCVFTPG
ncbi:MAG: hypothetical protein R3A48_15495 [Polyangiales bacterium]